MSLDEELRRLVREEVAAIVEPLRERLERPRGALRPDEAGDYLGYSETTVRQLMNDGELAFIQHGRTRRIAIAELDRWLADHARRGSSVA